MDEGGFEWDADNLGKIASHKVSAIEAEETILNDPIHWDDHPDWASGEIRWKVFGETYAGRFLVVVWTERGDLMRIVTAYEMDARDRKEYLRLRAKLS